ncbi:MAG: ABC transporter ATP-binding protein [Candidatus Heimdallarchaeota archaeon]|nr:ABC transporter ATP-binding protein [Candidatus Heimdallarchaeota archaeon]
MKLEDKDTIQLELSNVSFNYNQQGQSIKIFEDINLKCTAGNIITIMGPSGSGKTTLLHLLALIYKPSTGQIMLNGQEIDFEDIEKIDTLRKTYFGIHTQEILLFEKIGIVENLMIDFEIHSDLPEKEKLDREYLIELIYSLNLNHLLSRKVNELSMGEKQRLSIIRSLISKPKLLILDEPTASLDYDNVLSLIKILNKLRMNKDQITIIFTHDPLFLRYSHQSYRISNYKLNKIEN